MAMKEHKSFWEYVVYVVGVVGALVGVLGDDPYWRQQAEQQLQELGAK